MTEAPAPRRRRREPLRAQRQVDLARAEGDVVVDLRAGDDGDDGIDLTAPETAGVPTRRRILIVDDEPDVFGWLRIALEPLRWDVNGARTASDALEMAVRLLPEVVVLDQRLPDGTGLEVGRWLRMNQPSMVLVMFSAYIDQATEDEAVRLGIATISKVDTKALMTTLGAVRAHLDGVSKATHAELRQA